MLAVPDSKKIIDQLLLAASTAENDDVFDDAIAFHVLAALKIRMAQSRGHDRNRIINAALCVFATSGVSSNHALVARLFTIAAQYLEGVSLSDLEADLVELGFLRLW